MSAFPTAGHLASWARRRAPGQRVRGKRKGKSATGRGNPYIGGTLGETAASAGRTQTFLGAKLRRLCQHMPKKKAQGAIMRTQLVIAHALLSDPAAEYRDLGPGYYEQRAGIRRQARSHVRAWNASATRSPSSPSTPEPTPKPASSSPAPPASRTPPRPALRAGKPTAQTAAGCCRLPG